MEEFEYAIKIPKERVAVLIGKAGEVKKKIMQETGIEVDVDSKREHPSDILDYFRPKSDIIEQGHMPLNLRNYLDKHHALNRTAEELTRRGLTFLAARKLHKM